MNTPVFLLEDLSRFGKIADRINKLRELDLQLLQRLSWDPGTWAYKMYKEMVIKNSGVEPGTLRKHLRDLRKRSLIEILKEKTSPNSIPIKLTDTGIYFLIMNNKRMSDKVLKGLLKNYTYNIVFRLFLYPYVDQRTLYKIIKHNSDLVSTVSSYLYECCKEIGVYVNTINHAKIRYSTEQIFWWEWVPENEDQTNNLREFLKRKLTEKQIEPTDWIDHAKIEKSVDKDTIIISYNANSISIILNKSKTKALVKMKQKIIHELIVDYLKGLLSIEEPCTPIEESATRFLMLGTQRRVPYFLNDLAANAVSGSPEIQLLLRDERFMYFYNKIQKKIKNKFRELDEEQKRLTSKETPNSIIS